MKNTRIQVSLYVIIPLIFGGLTLLTTLLTYHMTRYHVARGMFPAAWPVIMLSMPMIVLSVICASIITWLLVHPVERFMKKAEELVPPEEPGQHDVQAQTGEFSRFERMFDRVSKALGTMEARRLFPRIVGHSASMRSVMSLIVKIAPTASPVLLLGESGSGKELVARSIHEHSPRASKPFIAINCAGIPEGLLESELFGHEKGSFTGAHARKAGKFELADEGTVLLDEIADMPLTTQAKILRALQEREIERVGGAEPIRVDIRVVAATNRDLAEEVAAGRFREDLFFRINAFTLHLPPLRERGEDISLLAQHFLDKLGTKQKFAPEATAALMAHSWPGNVRELMNAVETAAALAGEVLMPEHLPLAMASRGQIAGAGEPQGDNSGLDGQLAGVEKSMIIDALARTGGVQKKAADLLGIKERSLWHRIAKYEIDVAKLKQSL